MLPVFTLAIFLAEPARNPRAWPINLMLLDLAEAETPGHTWDAILWHPEAINPILCGKVAARVMGPAGREGNKRNLVPITDTGKLHLVGGILPASPTAGGERGKPGLLKDPKPLNEFDIKKGRVLAQLTISKIPFDFIHQKEIDVLLKWLFRFPDFSNYWTPCDEGIDPPEGQMITPEIVLLGISADLDTTMRLNNIHQKIRSRCSSFDYM